MYKPVRTKRQIRMGVALAVGLAGLVLGGGPAMSNAEMSTSGTEKATFASGCFWCTEAVFQQVDGVKTVISGYTGGRLENPTYKDVSTGNSGHAEAIQIEFDPSKVSYDELLELFWQSHDPTQLNRQGADVGEQYRSAIFYHGDAQRETAEKSRKTLEASGKYRGRVVTEIVPAGRFYKAESYHQDYYRNNRTAPYCRMVISPKLDKLGLKR